MLESSGSFESRRSRSPGWCRPLPEVHPFQKAWTGWAILQGAQEKGSGGTMCPRVSSGGVFVCLFVSRPNTQTNTLAVRSLPKFGSMPGFEEGGPRPSASLRPGDPLPRPTHHRCLWRGQMHSGSGSERAAGRSSTSRATTTFTPADGGERTAETMKRTTRSLAATAPALQHGERLRTAAVRGDEMLLEPQRGRWINGSTAFDVQPSD